MIAGLRARLVHDSLFAMIRTSLTQLGWFDSGRQHLPVSFIAEEVSDTDEVELNTLALVDGGVSTTEMELGSFYAEKRWQFFIDFYGESRPLAIQMAHDIRDILEGRISAIGRRANTFTVWDFTLATPVELFYCVIENVLLDRSHNSTKLYQKHWYSLAFTVIDEYDSDNDENNDE